jgi:hypothetical protein
MPFDLQSVAIGMVTGSIMILVLGGASLTQALCNPQPVDRSEKNKMNNIAKSARFHNGDEI